MAYPLWPPALYGSYIGCHSLGWGWQITFLYISAKYDLYIFKEILYNLQSLKCLPSGPLKKIFIDPRFRVTYSSFIKARSRKCHGVSIRVFFINNLLFI